MFSVYCCRWVVNSCQWGILLFLWMQWISNGVCDQLSWMLSSFKICLPSNIIQIILYFIIRVWQEFSFLNLVYTWISPKIMLSSKDLVYVVNHVLDLFNWALIFCFQNTCLMHTLTRVSLLTSSFTTECLVWRSRLV